MRLFVCWDCGLLGSDAVLPCKKLNFRGTCCLRLKVWSVRNQFGYVDRLQGRWSCTHRSEIGNGVRSWPIWTMGRNMGLGIISLPTSHGSSWPPSSESACVTKSVPYPINLNPENWGSMVSAYKAAWSEFIRPQPYTYILLGSVLRFLKKWCGSG
jgi:hypothetical protein